MSMDDEDADLIAAKLASIQEAQEAGIPVLEDIDEAIAKSLQEQQDAEASVSPSDVPVPPPAPKVGAKGKKLPTSTTSKAPKPVIPVWKEFVYVEFCFSTPEVKEGILVALDYNNYAEGAPMQRVGDKYYQTIALGCGKTYKYKFIVDGKDALDSALPQDEEKKYNTIAIAETGEQTSYAVPAHTGPGFVTLDTLPVTDLGAVTAERLEQFKSSFAQTKIPIQSTERIDSKVFTEKLLEFHRSVTWTIPNNSFINESAAEEAAKKKKEEAKKKADEEAAAAKKAEEDAKKAEEKKDESKEESKPEDKPADEKKAEESPKAAEEPSKPIEEAAKPADEKKAEEAAKPADEKKAEEAVKPAEENKDEKSAAEKKEADKSDEKKDEKSEDKKDKADEKAEEKKLEEENDPYPEFDEDEKEPEGTTADIAVVRKSAKFTISFASVQIVDLIELDFGLVRTWFEGGDSLKYKYALTLEFNTAPRTWSKVWDRLPLEDIFNSSVVGRGKKSRMMQLSTAFRAQKVRFRLHAEKKSDAELEEIKSQSASLIRKFTYSEDFDKNGVLYWIGSSFGKSSYANPQSSGDVTVTLSHSESSNRAIELVISHSLVKESYAFGGSAPVWFTVDLGPHLALSPDHYTLRHGYSYSDSILCDWELQGSNNNETWTTLHAQLEAPFNSGWATKSWPVLSGDRYRYFRVYQKGNYAYGPGQGPNGSPYMYIGGFELYGDLCSTTGVSPNVVSSFSVATASMSPPGIEKNREFNFSHDGDTNGVLYCIGSTDGTEKWVNPARSGKVKTKVSGQSWNEADKWNCLARASDNHSSSYWGGSLPLWFWVDLGADYKICPNHYSLRHGNNYNENFMQNWEFQGSHDCEEWVKLHSGTDSPFSYAHQIVSWPVTDCKEYYRYFRIVQKSNSINGPGNESGPYMYIGGFEVYGTQQTSAGGANQSTAESQKKRSLHHAFLTNKDYHVQLIKTVQAESTPTKLRLQCLETLDTIIARNIHVPLYILDAIEVKTFVRVFLTEGDKASSSQGGRWLQYLLSVNNKDNVFRKKLLDAILELLPVCVDTLQSAHNLDQLTNLLMSTWKADAQVAADKCLQVLLDLGKRLQSGLDQNYQLLRSRFGLYEFSLESDSFAEPPPKKKKKTTNNDSNNYNSYDQQPEEEVEEEENAEDSGESADTAEALESQLVSATLAFDRSKAELRTQLEHIQMSASTAPSTTLVKDITKSHKACIAAQQQVHRCRTALQSKFPGHSGLKNVNQTTQLDRWNVIAERLLVLITSYQHAERKKASVGAPAPASLFSNDVIQDMFNLFCLHGSPVLRKGMTNFLSHNVDANTSFAVQVLRRLYTDEQQATNELLPYEEIFSVLRELSMVDESAVVSNSRQLFSLLAEAISPKKVDYQLAAWTLRLIGSLLKSSLAPPHHYSKCRSCSAAPIRGIRYRCLQCVDYDLCSKCEASHQHDPSHMLVKIPKTLPLSPSLNDAKLAARAKEPLLPVSLYAACATDPSLEEPKWPPVTTVSHSTMCDFCGEGITGIRYKCINCNQYNLCSNCEGSTSSYNAIDSHYKGHLFCKLYHPLPPPSPNQNDAKTLVGVVLHPGLYPHPTRKDVIAAKKDPTATVEAPAATPSAKKDGAAAASSNGSPVVSSPGTERTAATFGKQMGSPLMRASTGVPMARNTPSPSLADALQAAEPEFSDLFLSTLVNTMNYAMTQATPSYELLLLASNCLRSLAYQYSPEEIMNQVVRNSPQFMDTIGTVANMPYPTRVAINGLIHELCRSSTYINMPKETAESTLKPLRAAFRQHIAKLLAAAIKGGNDKATATAVAAPAKESISAATSSDKKDATPEAAKPVSASRVQFFLGLLQGCADTSDIVIEKKAAKVVADWRSASAPVKDFLPSSTTVYPIDNTLLGLIWSLLDEQNLGGATISSESVHVLTSSITLLQCADLTNVAGASSFHKFIRNTFLSKAQVHRPFWRQLHALLEKLINHSTEIATNIINNLFSLFTDALAQPATARDMLIVTTLALMKKKKSLLQPSMADLAKLISHCIGNMPEAKVLDSAVEEDHHVVELDVLSLATTVITTESFNAAKKSELLAQESMTFPIVTPLISWLAACDIWHASKKSGLGSALQAIAIRKQLVAFLHQLCDEHEGFAKRALTGLAESFKKNKLTSPKLVDLTTELMSNEALARHFIVDLEMGEVLQSELETAEGSVSTDSTARPSMYDSTPSVPATLYSGMTSLTSTCKTLEPADDSSADNTFRYGVPGSTSHQWCHRWQKEKDGGSWGASQNKSVDYYHTLNVTLQLPQPALIREIWFDYVRQYNVAPKPPPYVLIEMGTCKEDLTYVTTYDVKPQTLLNDSNTMSETFKIPFAPSQITQCVRLTFERAQGADSMTLGALALLGTFNLFEDVTSKESAPKGRNPSNNALNVLEHAFHYDAIRSFYGDYKGTTKLALQLLTMSTEETKNQVQTIALHLARHRAGLVSTLFAHFSKTGIPSTSSRFVGRLCAIADDQTGERVSTLAKLVFGELGKGAAGSSTSDRLVSLMNALSEALFVMLAAHRPVTLALTDEQIIALGDATLKSFGSSLTQEACIRILSCLIQADPSRYGVLQAKFGPKTEADLRASLGSDSASELGYSMTMLGLLAPLTHQSAELLLNGPLLKLLLADIVGSNNASDSPVSEANLSRAVNFIHSVSHHPIVKEWVGTNVLQGFMDILSERKFGATIQFAIQNALRTACNLSQTNQDAVAAYLMKVFKAASSSSSGVSDAMLQLLEDMLNINDKVMLCMHSKNETSEELVLCESSTLAGASAIMALDPENSHNDMVLDEEELAVSGGTKSDYNWKTAICANPVPSNGPVSWNVTIERSSGGNMMIGVCMKGHSHSIYIGGNSSGQKGWSYYGCTPGYKYHNGNASEYGRAFNTGDVVTITLDQSEGTLAFSQNGEELGVAYTDMPTDEPLYPAVSLCQNSDAVKFGPFSTTSSVRASGIDNKHPLYFQRSNRVSPIALATTLSTVADSILGGRTDRKVVFTRFPKSTDEKDAPALKEELPFTTSLRELLDPSTEVLDLCFALVPVIGDKKDLKKGKEDKKDAKKDKKDDAADEASKKEKEKEKAELAARKAELEAKKKADQTGVMKRFASQKGLEMLVTVLSQRLNPAPAAQTAPATGTGSGAASTPATPVPDTADATAATATADASEVKPVEATATPADTEKDTKPVVSDADPGLDIEDPIEEAMKDDASDVSEETKAMIKKLEEGSAASDEDPGFGLFDEEYPIPAAPAPAASSKSKSKKKDEKQKKGFVSKATWAKWVRLLSDCLIIDGVVDSFVQDEDCRAMLFAAIEAAKLAPSSGESGSMEPLPQPSKAALEAPLNPLYKMLLSTLTAAEPAKAAEYREQLMRSGLLKSVLVEMMDLCDLMPVKPESESFKVEADALKAEREEKAAAKKKKDSGTTYWAKGTGYGTNSDDKNDFNLTAYVRETVLTGKKVTHLLEVVAFMLTLDASVSLDALPAYQKDINDMVCASALQPVLESYLRNDSLLEMSRSLALYKVVFRISQILTTQEQFLPLLCPEDSSSNIYTLMEHLQRIAALVQKLPATSEKRLKETEAKDDEANKKKRGNAKKPSKKKPVASEEEEVKPSEEDGADEPNEESEKLLATEIVKTFDLLKGKVAERREAAKAKAREASAADTTLSKLDKLVDVYITTLRDLQFGDADMLEKGKDDEFAHHYKSRIKSDTAPGQKKMKRLVQELAVLSTSLPLHPDSSVFLRVDEQRIDICKVLITGPDKTPYESGCFQFDMYLDAEYPKGSPKINLMTTGHGSVRFNPNLYNCGKVCLSLLGTWPGGANEEWNEETSTILQLMISIQSLIFVPEPYFNEPGYESTMNSDSGRTQSRQYNENIRMQTVRWAMIDQLKNPSPGFEDIIKAHFKLKKDLVLEQLDSWMAEFVAHCDEGHIKEFEKLVQEMQRLLNTL